MLPRIGDTEFTYDQNTKQLTCSTIARGRKVTEHYEVPDEHLEDGEPSISFQLFAEALLLKKYDDKHAPKLYAVDNVDRIL